MRFLSFAIVSNFLLFFLISSLDFHQQNLKDDLNSYLTISRKGSQEKKISINIIVVEKGAYKLIYKDNGPGLKKGIDFETATSLGLDLIKGLSGQIDGKATYAYENGSVFTIFFKDLEARNK